MWILKSLEKIVRSIQTAAHNCSHFGYLQVNGEIISELQFLETKKCFILLRMKVMHVHTHIKVYAVIKFAHHTVTHLKLQAYPFEDELPYPLTGIISWIVTSNVCMEEELDTKHTCNAKMYVNMHENDYKCARIQFRSIVRFYVWSWKDMLPKIVAYSSNFQSLARHNPRRSPLCFKLWYT